MGKDVELKNRGGFKRFCVEQHRFEINYYVQNIDITIFKCNK